MSVDCKPEPDETEPNTVLGDSACGPRQITEEEKSVLVKEEEEKNSMVKEEEEEQNVFKGEEGDEDVMEVAVPSECWLCDHHSAWREVGSE